MKKLTTAVLVILFTINFTSCSDNESITEAPQGDLLKSFTLKRDASGSYSLDYEIANNTNAISVKNEENKTNEIYLSNSEEITQRAYTQDFVLDNNSLKIGFVNANTDNRANIFVEDENITFSKDEEFLNTYSVKGNDDGTYQLDFVVNDGVKTEFVYNDETQTYEVHLSEGNANDNDFSSSLEKDANGVLKIDFVNHKNNNQNRSTVAKTGTTIRRPRVVVSLNGE